MSSKTSFTTRLILASALAASLTGCVVAPTGTCADGYPAAYYPSYAPIYPAYGYGNGYDYGYPGYYGPTVILGGRFDRARSFGEYGFYGGQRPGGFRH